MTLIKAGGEARGEKKETSNEERGFFSEIVLGQTLRDAIWELQPPASATNACWQTSRRAHPASKSPEVNQTCRFYHPGASDWSSEIAVTLHK